MHLSLPVLDGYQTGLVIHNKLGIGLLAQSFASSFCPEELKVLFGDWTCIRKQANHSTEEWPDQAKWRVIVCIVVEVNTYMVWSIGSLHTLPYSHIVLHGLYETCREQLWLSGWNIQQAGTESLVQLPKRLMIMSLLLLSTRSNVHSTEYWAPTKSPSDL